MRANYLVKFSKQSLEKERERKAEERKREERGEKESIIYRHSKTYIA